MWTGHNLSSAVTFHQVTGVYSSGSCGNVAHSSSGQVFSVSQLLVDKSHSEIWDQGFPPGFGHDCQLLPVTTQRAAEGTVFVVLVIRETSNCAPRLMTSEQLLLNFTYLTLIVRFNNWLEFIDSPAPRGDRGQIGGKH